MDFSLETLTAAINDYRNGAVAQVVLQNEAYVDTLIEKFLPDITPDEESQLEKPLYEFGRTGVAAELVPLLLTLAELPAAPVVVLPTETVAAAPAAPPSYVLVAEKAKILIASAADRAAKAPWITVAAAAEAETSGCGKGA